MTGSTLLAVQQRGHEMENISNHLFVPRIAIVQSGFCWCQHSCMGAGRIMIRLLQLVAPSDPAPTLKYSAWFHAPPPVQIQAISSNKDQLGDVVRT
jgi:hypothetical protein